MKRRADKTPDLQSLSIKRLIEIVPEDGYPVLVPLVGFETIAQTQMPAGDGTTLSQIYAAEHDRYNCTFVVYDPEEAVAYPILKDSKPVGPALQVTSVCHTLECLNRSGQEIYLGAYQTARHLHSAIEALHALHGPHDLTPAMLAAGEHAVAVCYDASVDKALGNDPLPDLSELPEYASQYLSGQISSTVAIYLAMEQARLEEQSAPDMSHDSPQPA
jgi:hypothetical protein